MIAAKRRVSRLEDKLGTTKRRPVIRITIFRVGCEPDPGKSTCIRSLTDGMVTEIIHWGGRRDQMTDEVLDRFVEAFPIELYAPSAVVCLPTSLRDS
jgi:hypothetical protein